MKPLIQTVLRSRSNFIELGVVALFLGLGVNLLATWSDGYLTNHNVSKWPWLNSSRLEFFSAVFLILAGVLFFIRLLFKERVLEKKIDGVILINKDTKNPLSLHGYKFASMLGGTLKAAFVENKALRTAWESEPFIKRISEPEDPKKSETENKKDEVSYMAITKCEFVPGDNAVSEKSILIEAIEFCLIELLSMHLSTYFDNMEDCEREIATVDRERIPELLLRNRVLSLLSTPIEDRQIFTTSGYYKNPPKGEVHVIYASNGAQYRRFDLALPKKTKVIRVAQGNLKFEHPRFELEIYINFQGFTQNLPDYFSSLYIGGEGKKIDAKMVSIHVRSKLRRRSLLLVSGWRYYEWIDSFINYLIESVSFEAFLSEIDWASASTRIRADIILEKRRLEKKKERAGKLDKTSGDASSEN